MKEWLPSGTVIAHYQISARISANGVGEVYQATDISSKASGLEMALKLMPAALINDDETRRRFLQNFKTISQMRHLNFCRVYEAEITEDGRPFVAMEYVKGQSLDIISLNYRLAISEVISIVIQIADALDVLHKQGWLHLAIKPSNLMMTSGAQVKILDLGVGLVFPSQKIIESPDQRSDVFSLGAALYELLTGSRPFFGSSAPEYPVSADQIAPITELREDSSPALNEVVMKALAKDPDARYQTMDAFANDLRILSLEERGVNPKRVAPAFETRDGGKRVGAEGDQLPPGSLIDDLKRALEGLLEGKTKSQIGTQPKLKLEPERTFLADIVYFCRLYWRYLLASFLFFAGLAIAIVIVASLRGKPPESDEVRLTQTTSLTTSGKVRGAAISPDGERLVYAIDEGWGQSLILKELKSAIETRVASAQSIEYRGLTFSPDGRWINYFKAAADSDSGGVYRVAARGGSEQPLPIANAISSISFSPNGKSLAAIRKNDAGSETSLWVGDEAGEGADLAVHSGSAAFQSTAPAWSPDGRVILCALRDSESDLFLKLVAIGVEDRHENTIVSGRWSEIDRVVWRAAAGGLIVTASDPITRRSQLYSVDYPSGDVARLIQDRGNYRDASLTRDDGLLIAVQSDALSNIWVADVGAATQAKQITTGRLDGVNGIAWMPDGRLVYVSLTNGRESVWIGGHEGEQQRPLPTESGDGGQFQPTVSQDGRFIGYVIERASGVYLARNEIEKRELNSLASERLAFFPQFTPDGKWIFYSTIRDGRSSIAKIPSSGGSPQIMIQGRAWRAVVSPDGSKIACNYLDQTNAWRMAVLPVSGGAPTMVFDATRSMNRIIQWSPDGERLSFIVTRGAASNIWTQPVSGGAPSQLTDFKTDRIFNFAWSRDGKRLALAHGWESSDVALIQNFR